jgi:hypothetical protein
MFLGLRRKQWVLFGLGLFFALISREDAIVALGAFGLYDVDLRILEKQADWPPSRL